MDKPKLEYLRSEILKQVEWHRRQARDLARGYAANEDERMDNRIRAEAASWRAEVWIEAFGTVSSEALSPTGNAGEAAPTGSTP